MLHSLRKNVEYNRGDNKYRYCHTTQMSSQQVVNVESLRFDKSQSSSENSYGLNVRLSIDRNIIMQWKVTVSRLIN